MRRNSSKNLGSSEQLCSLTPWSTKLNQT